MRTPPLGVRHARAHPASSSVRGRSVPAALAEADVLLVMLGTNDAKVGVGLLASPNPNPNPNPNPDPDPNPGPGPNPTPNLSPATPAALSASTSAARDAILRSCGSASDDGLGRTLGLGLGLGLG